MAKAMQVFGGARLSYAGGFRGCPRMLVDLWGVGLNRPRREYIRIGTQRKWPMPNMPLIDSECKAVLNVLRRGMNSSH